MPYSCQDTLYYPGYTNMYYGGETANIKVVSNGELVIEKTKFSELNFRGKTITPKKQYKIDESESAQIFKEPPEKKVIEE